MENIKKLAELFNVSCDYLMDWIQGYEIIWNI
jgi:hypothetical protein